MFDIATDSTPAYLVGLNGAQRAAVEHSDGPLLVVAGAGTGKTRTLVARVARLLDEGVAAERILLLTFTRRAAQEMLRRATRLTGSSRTGRVWGGTFHAVGNRLLRSHGRALGLPPNFTVMDQSDGADLLNLIRAELGLGRGRRRFPKKETLAAIYSRSVNARAKLSDVLERHFPWCKDEGEGISSIFEVYTARKQRQAVLDFDDLLLYWLALMRSEAGGTVAQMFDHILVDEYQDTNAVQADILRAMRSSNSNIMAVGDDAQSIYSFRAATVRNILDFPQHFPEATIIKLEKNYRSSQPILDVSNEVIAEASQRYEKNLFCERVEGARPVLFTTRDEEQQSNMVCDAVLEAREQQGVPFVKQAVLFRTGHHSAQLEIELTRRNIPFVKYGGLKFVEAAHIKDVIALLRVLENPYDELAWFRILQLLEGVGPVSAGRIIDELGVRGAREAPVESSPLRRLVDDPPSLGEPTQPQLIELASALGDCSRPGTTPAADVERLSRWCDDVFARIYDNPAVRSADLVRLEQIASSYSTRGHFIAELALDPPASTGELAGPPLLDEDYLVLSTIHSAKGGEWSTVHVIHAADGMIPSDMSTGDDESLEEERRLFYVALTRAINELRVYFPLRYYHRRMGWEDPHNYAQLTRFVSDAVRPLFDQRSLEPNDSDGLPERPHPGVQAIGDFLADLWRA
jgi:DNA helicase-2/ATP-dependent DNA helicase PcrA